MGVPLTPTVAIGSAYDAHVASPGLVSSPNQLTIEQLAAHSGMSVRNIRSHQARGLLAPPEVRLRVGYYGPDHVTRLRLIRHLQDEGFNLGGIKRLLDDTGPTVDRVQRVKQALTEPHEETPETLTLTELGRRFRVAPAEAPHVLARAQRLGILVLRDDGRFDAPTPSLLALAEEAVVRGISLDAAFGAFEALERSCDEAATALVQLFLAQVWGPFEEDMSAERWAAMDESIQGLSPLASNALKAIFQRQMKGQLEAAFGQITARLMGADQDGTGAG
jgi:DNA-binding transcriptional MerR regulator